MRATIPRLRSGLWLLSECSETLLRFERSCLPGFSLSQQLRSFRTGTGNAQSCGMSIARPPRYDRRRLLFGLNRPSDSQLPFDRGAEEKCSHFRRGRSTGALVHKSARHEFVIEDLGQAGWLKPHRYRYFCIRCRWLFLIENRLGDATAVDGSGRPLREPEQSTRVVTFAMGPCAAALREIDVVGARRGFGRGLTHPTEEHQRESAKSGSTLLRTLLTGLITAVTKRHSSRHHVVLVRGRQ